MWLTFKRSSNDWKDALAYFFELMTDSYRYGLGYYSASKITMDILRKSINNNPKEFLKTIFFYPRKSIIKLMGDKYKRPLESGHSEIIQDWYQRKSFYLVVIRKMIKFSSLLDLKPMW